MKKEVIGLATLYLGDCLEILPTLERADVVITDPPYGIGESSRKNASRGKPFGSRADAKNTRGTFVAPTDYGTYEWDAAPASAERIALTLRAGARAVIWGGNYFPLPPQSKWLVWDKINSGDFADCELAWTNLPGAVRIFRHMWNGMLRDSERGTPRVHPTQKPVALMRWCVDQAKAESVVDPFMGSGSTGVACMEMQRPFVGIEADERYFTIACRRIEDAQRQERLFG
jgi:DNA modification methylase